ncbi:3,4-dihydroxy-2-butanone-4-phosphate synthase [Salinibacterium sp. NSLL150]|uniref:3,4-dihydroxy-2-butanone-4-phosphate synthase n=1 Tax=unclassified Salinibacterium TaxID=2632331 RepID=UPI0018CD385D|nr:MULTISPECIES: 3,4-dihydroxy-2-butanone-4-phosphate synthase [unclassified Salinibacterium]MBH0099771.1 3,4-dihydroxy-2-butanone-4-phosphate synthase [Salinibacterium sp. NSLL35]MBH0102525.1 3,4-dihydroxy-2-butanone-4-phosphate synthase [Salinibacterium sp. NSLL150]MBH0105285.1 3,4-dihydroxy-2-butanone-4-phosphate synthase [Salinibacterium sp. NSLL16]MBH0108045.1 3,4-dihydroxy-2-butanone-4-phosphate synthase [Salinibacterium sp. NSLL17]
MSLATIPDAIEAIRAGRPVIVADDEGRENEGDVIISAELASQEWIAWMVRHSSGFICAPMTNEIADALALPPMVAVNEDPRGTAYTVSVDAAARLSTGISASDRAHTLRVLADPLSMPSSLHRPGHIMPLRAVDGGVRERDGHTEASVDLMKLAGLRPVAAISEIVHDSGEMMRLPELIEFGAREGVLVITILDLMRWLEENRCDTIPAPIEPIPEMSRVTFEVETTIPTVHGSFTVRAYRDNSTGADHVAFIAPGTLDHTGNGPTLVRVHSECLTGEAFGSLKCECGPQLDSALETIQRDGGAVIYLRGHEGRGIGLINKLRAYRLQEDGLDTLDANLALGLPADSRDYGAAVGILKDLGISSVSLLSNNPEKKRQLEERGVIVGDLVPLVVGVGASNEGYLETKRDRMGHQLPTTAVLDEARLTAKGL